MQSVPASAFVVRRAPRRGVTGLVLVLVLVFGALVVQLAPTRGWHVSVRRAAPATAGLIAGVPLQQARCAQWQAGSDAQRRRTVDALAHVVGGPTPYGPGTTLTTSQAYALFARDCASPIANGFLLYELYIRAAGFRSVSPGG